MRVRVVEGFAWAGTFRHPGDTLDLAPPVALVLAVAGLVVPDRGEPAAERR